MTIDLQKIPQITRITFDIIPKDTAGKRFLTPYAYIFRGILLNWLDLHSHQLASEVHQKQPKSTPLHYGDYSIHQDYLYLSPQGWSTLPNRTDHDGNNFENAKTAGTRDSQFHSINHSSRPLKHSSSFHERNEVQGLRYTVNLFDNILSQTFLEILLGQQDQTVQFGPQEGIISRVMLETVSLKSMIQQTRPVHAITMDLISPISFSVMDGESDLRFPLPEYLFKFLAKMWNYYVGESPLAINEEFIPWVKQNISATSFELGTVGWEMGKERKFVGCKGWVTYVVHKDHPRFTHWLDTLCRFGQYSGVGNGRSAGFGQFRIRKIDYASQTPLAVEELINVAERIPPNSSSGNS